MLAFFLWHQETLFHEATRQSTEHFHPTARLSGRTAYPGPH